MSQNQIFTCGLILREHLGEVTEKVGTCLIKNGAMPLRTIAQETGLQLEQVKKALSTMIHHNIAYFKQNERGIVEYVVNHNHILYRLRFPRFLSSTKRMFGDIGEFLVEELLLSGQCQLTDLMNSTTANLVYEGENSVSKGQVYETFCTLVQQHFVQRCPAVAKTTKPVRAPQFQDPELEERLMYIVPPQEDKVSRKRRISSDDEEHEPASKRLRTDSGSVAGASKTGGDSKIYWRVNYDRFLHCMRDQVIYNAILKKFDFKATEIVRTILKISSVKTDENAQVTTPVSLHEIYNEMPTDHGVSKTLLEQYLTVLAEDSCNFVYKVGDSGGGMYSIHIHNALTSLAKAHIESVVEERFGSKCLRIVKLLMMKKHLEQKQIEDVAMIPSKEAKQLLYNMFGQHFVTTTEVPKTPDHAPSRTFYLFSVDVCAVVRMLLETTYKAVGNAICRRLHETKEHKRLLDKQQRVEAIAAQLEQSGADPSQKEELEEMITPPEKAQLDKIKHMTNKLEHSEVQLDDTTFVLEMYLHYSKLNI